MFAAALAWLSRTLSPSGTAAAAVVGSLVLLGGGWEGGVVLSVFFVTSNALPYILFPAQGETPQQDDRRAGSRRTGWQVAANGGAAAIGGLAGMVHADLGWWMITAGLAGAAADTWSTEIGQLRGGMPIDLWTGVELAPGTSGGVTAVGTVAGAAGAAIIGLTAGVVSGSAELTAVATAIGLAAMVLDSAIGGRWQAGYFCPACGVTGETLRLPCDCLPTALHRRGVKWINNDTVNAIATSAAAAAGALFWWLRYAS